MIEPAKQFVARYGEQGYSQAREAERAARKRGKVQLAAFYGKVVERIEKASAVGVGGCEINNDFSVFIGVANAFAFEAIVVIAIWVVGYSALYATALAN
jgi:hypothetical protein